MYKAISISKRAHWHIIIPVLHSPINIRTRFTGGGSQTVVQQPAATPYNMTDEEKMLLKSQADYYSALSPMIKEYSTSLMPLETQRERNQITNIMPAEAEMTDLERQAMAAYMPRYIENINTNMPAETAKTRQLLALSNSILGGGYLPGDYGKIGTALDVPTIDTNALFGSTKAASDLLQEEAMDKARRSTEARMNALGILPSGVTGEMERRNNRDIALARAENERADLWKQFDASLNEANTRRGLGLESQLNQRQELANLMNMAMGVPLTITGGDNSAQTIAGLSTSTPNAAIQNILQQYGNAGNVISGQNSEQNNYALAARPTYGQAQKSDPFGSMLGSIGGSIGGTVGGIGMSKFMFSIPCFGGETAIETTTGIKRIDEVVAGDQVMTDSGFRPVLCNKVHDAPLDYCINCVRVTKDHPIVMKDGSLRVVGSLSLGHALYKTNVWSKHEVHTGEEKVYNLIVEGHRYFVNDDILVHDGMEVSNG